jgi:hypothetical protein
VLAGEDIRNANPSMPSRPNENGLGLNAPGGNQKPKGFTGENQSEAARTRTQINSENKILRTKTERLGEEQTQIFH